MLEVKILMRLRNNPDWFMWTLTSPFQRCQEKWMPRNHSTTPMKMRVTRQERILWNFDSMELLVEKKKKSST